MEPDETRPLWTTASRATPWGWPLGVMARAIPRVIPPTGGGLG